MEDVDKLVLSDEECDEFRRMPLSFNDMVRAIYSSGYSRAKIEGAEIIPDSVQSSIFKLLYSDDRGRGVLFDEALRELANLTGYKS